MYHAILTSIDMRSPRAIWARQPKLEAPATAEVEHLGTDDLRHLLDVATATGAARIHLHTATITRDEVKAIIQWRVRRGRRGTLLWLALWLLGIAATVAAAAQGWYTGGP